MDMDQEPLNKIWRAIADAGKNGESPVYFWQDVESALNEDCREFFLTFSGQRHPIRVAWDDDKVHLQFSTHDVRSDPHFLCGGQAHQHTMSNCRGLTIHSAILAASGFPVGFRTSRQGESEHQCYETLLRFMFAYCFTVSGAAHLGLDRIIFCSDRGYWTPALILLILSFGGTVFGTIKRSYWVPFTYNQKRQDKREQIETKYGRSIFVAFSRWGEYMLKIMAWRGGTGNVSLAMNSDCSEDQLVTMEFKLKNSADAKWYHDKDLTRDQRKLKAFQQISGIDISKEDLDKVDAHIQHSLNVVMLTCTDLDFMWFTLRMFAITSSSSVASIKRAAPHIPPTAPNRPAFVNVLGYSGLLSHLGSLNRTSASTSSDEEDDEDGLTIDAALVSKMVKLMRRPTQNIANQCADFAGQIKDAVGNGSLVDATMQAMLVELGINRDRAITTPSNKMKTLLRQWITSIQNVRSVPDVDENSNEESSDEDSQDSASSPNVITYNFPYDKLLMNYAVLFHRTSQSIGGTKKPDIGEDTIESIRDRNNKRQPFHKTMSWLHSRLRQSAKESRERNALSSSTIPSNANNDETFLQEEAPRYNRRQPDAGRVEKSHEILGKAGVTGLTPLGRGRSKAATIRHENYGDIVNRNNKCAGCSARLYDDSKPTKSKKVGFATKSHVCDLCGTRGVSTFCTGCKRILCYDADRSKQLDDRLRGPDGERLRREFPVLAELSRGNVPAFYCQVGQVNGKNFTVGRSCYHIAHPHHLFSPHMQAPDDDDVEMEDATAGEDDNIARIANATRRSTSPLRSLRRPV